MGDYYEEMGDYYVTEVVNVSDLTSNSSTVDSNFCNFVLYADIAGSRIRYWDLLILAPNLAFLVYLLATVGGAVSRLRRTLSRIFTVFYALIAVVVLMSVARCLLAMTANLAEASGSVVDKILWLVLRFFLLATELSVLVFGLAFGHLQSNKTIHYVLLVTFSIGFVYSSVQGILEFTSPSDIFHVATSSGQYDLFGHGGTVFLFLCSLLFAVLYLMIYLLPYTAMRRYFSLPTKRGFYMYCGFLSFLNWSQCLGACLLHFRVYYGLCIVNVTSYFYFAFYAAVVYRTFLFNFFRIKEQRTMFSYKTHYDNSEDTVSLPRHQIDDEPRNDISVFESMATNDSMFANLHLAIDHDDHIIDVRGAGDGGGRTGDQQMTNPVA